MESVEVKTNEQVIYEGVNILNGVGAIIGMKRVRYRDGDDVTEYIVLHNVGGYHPWATHRMYADNYRGVVSFESGNYFTTEANAWEDFKDRT